LVFGRRFFFHPGVLQGTCAEWLWESTIDLYI
jgi:hypothetical protein